MRRKWAPVCLAAAITGCHSDSVRTEGSRRVPVRTATRNDLAETLHRAAAARHEPDILSRRAAKNVSQNNRENALTVASGGCMIQITIAG